MAFVQADAVVKHALGKVRANVSGLDFQVQKRQGLSTRLQRDLRQQVHPLFTLLEEAFNLAQFLVQKNRGYPPVNALVGSGPEQGQTLRQPGLQRGFPDAIKVGSKVCLIRLSPRLGFAQSVARGGKGRRSTRTARWRVGKVRKQGHDKALGESVSMPGEARRG